jgi:DNA invertase Pin-like site-specific DNA recombinase
MLVGYARTSTLEQVAGLEAQVRDLRGIGCEEIFQEQVSSTARARPGLEAAVGFVRRGDVLVVTRLDRLARSMPDLLATIARLQGKGCAFRSLDLGADTASATGELILHVLGSVAAFERRLLLERQREGIAKAKSEGRYKGRAPTVRRRAGEILHLRAAGVKVTEIARRIGADRRSVHRVIAAAHHGSVEAYRPAG